MIFAFKMNIRTLYILTAVLSVVGVITLTPAFAQVCLDCSEEELAASAAQELLDETPISIWADAEQYDHESIIMIEGQVANMRSGNPITLTVINPINNIVRISQIDLDSDGAYSTTLNTSGELWKYDGTYTIRVQYGSQSVNNKVLVQLTGGVAPPTDIPTESIECASNELSVLDSYCIPFSITGGSVTGAKINPGVSIVVDITSVEPGTITLSPASTVFENYGRDRAAGPAAGGCTRESWCGDGDPPGSAVPPATAADPDPGHPAVAVAKDADQSPPGRCGCVRCATSCPQDPAELSAGVPQRNEHPHRPNRAGNCRMPPQHERSPGPPPAAQPPPP